MPIALPIRTFVKPSHYLAALIPNFAVIAIACERLDPPKGHLSRIYLLLRNIDGDDHKWARVGLPFHLMSSRDDPGLDSMEPGQSRRIYIRDTALAAGDLWVHSWLQNTAGRNFFEFSSDGDLRLADLGLKLRG